MAINPEIRDQAYQFFIEEAPELLQILETELLTLNHDRNTSKIHNLMRAAHSIKGGAASVGLDVIATLAHRLENIFKALYSDTLEIDTDLEDQLLRAYDCLRLPLMEQVTTGYVNAEQALAVADPILTQIEVCCGDALFQDSYIPSSSELGINMVASIVEIDVAQSLAHLTNVLAQPQAYDVAGELRAQIEVFAGFAELLNLPEFGAIADAVQRALQINPHRVIEITQLAIADFEQARQAILADNRSVESYPSAELTALGTIVAVRQSNLGGILDSAIALESDNATEQNRIENYNVENYIIEDYTIEHDKIHRIAIEQDALHKNNIDSKEIELGIKSDVESDVIDPIDAALPLLESIFGRVVMENTNSIPGDILAAINSETNLDYDLDYEIDEIDLDTTDLDDTNLNSSNLDDNQNFVDREDILNAIDINQERPQSQRWREPETTEPEPVLTSEADVSSTPEFSKIVPFYQSTELHYSNHEVSGSETSFAHHVESTVTSNLTVRVDADRLERMNNLVGELMINRDGLSLQNEQLQGVLKELLNRFERFQKLVGRFQELSNQTIANPTTQPLGFAASYGQETASGDITQATFPPQSISSSSALVEFDALEMDSYGALHLQAQEIQEDLMQLEESVDDISLFVRQSNYILDQQRQSLMYLQDELKWSRMLPLSELLNRFPRVLRDLSTTYHKPVRLSLVGAETLVDKAVLEKLYDPLLHLLRNAFDHGIEPPLVRQQRGKPEQGQIEIRAFHKGNQTIIEVKDDGQGLNLDRIRSRAFELGWLAPDQLLIVTPSQLLELIFEPGFSTATQVSELSGRGVGLDVVRSQLAAIKGTVSVTSTLGKGTTFTLYLPLTLTITRLVIGLVGSTAFAIPAEGIEEILTPQTDQTKQSGSQRFFYWREQIIPAYRLIDLVEYNCPLPEVALSKALVPVSIPEEWAAPILILRHDQQFVALEVERLVNEQELVIKPFGSTIAPPSYAYGCTILGDGSVVPVIDVAALLSFRQAQPDSSHSNHSHPTSSSTAIGHPPIRKPSPTVKTIQAPTILVVDDAITLRRTLALSLERQGFRVLQARDGWEAIDQLQQSASVKLIICDVEMPNMNGFEFLSYRRQNAQVSNIPTVMLTSRSNDKHRWLATQLGATAYFTKPYLEQEFLKAIQSFLRSDEYVS